MRKLAILLCLALPATAFAAEKASVDVLPNMPFKEGDTITFDQLEKLKDFLPPQFWENREFFFYEGMQLEVGPRAARLQRGRRLQGREREVQGPDQARRGRRDVRLHRRPAVRDRVDRLQG